MLHHKEGFKGLVHTVQEEINVALFASQSKSKKLPNRKAYDDDTEPPPNKQKCGRKHPPFLKHYNDSTDKKYKIGDTKEHDGSTFHFCDAPTHKDQLKRHTHSRDQCCVRKAWLQESGGDNANISAQANAGEVTDAHESSGDTDATYALTSEDGSEQNLNALLAIVINLVTNNDVLRDHIAKAINSASSI